MWSIRNEEGRIMLEIANVFQLWLEKNIILGERRA